MCRETTCESHQNYCSDTHDVPKPQQLLTVESKSLLLLLISAVCYSFMSCFVKLATEAGLPSVELVFIRAVAQGSMVIMGMFCYTTIDENQRTYDGSNTGTGTTKRVGEEGKMLLIQRPFGVGDRVQKLVIARGMIGGFGFGFVLYYYTVSALPLGDATTLLSLNPVVTIVLAAIFLGESIHSTHIFSAAASIIGSVLIARPSFLFGSSDNHDVTSYNTLGYITALVGTCCGACVILLIRSAGKSGVHTLQLIFSWSVFGMLNSVIIGIILPMVMDYYWSASGDDAYEKIHRFHFPTSSESWWYVFGLVGFGAVGHFLMNYAGQTAPAGVASLVRCSSILFSYALEIVVFGQIPTKTTM